MHIVTVRSTCNRDDAGFVSIHGARACFKLSNRSAPSFVARETSSLANAARRITAILVLVGLTDPNCRIHPNPFRCHSIFSRWTNYLLRDNYSLCSVKVICRLLLRLLVIRSNSIRIVSCYTGRISLSLPRKRLWYCEGTINESTKVLTTISKTSATSTCP